MFYIYVDFFDLIDIIATRIEYPYKMNNKEFLEIIKENYEILLESILKKLELPYEIKILIREKTEKLNPLEIIRKYEKIAKKFLENHRKSYIPLPKKYYEKESTSY